MDHMEKVAFYKNKLLEDLISQNPEYRKQAIRNIRKAKSNNIGGWQSDDKHNSLYVTGYSGSGKSTVARGLYKPGKTNIIHLDQYFDNPTDRSFQDHEFNSYLKQRFPDYTEIANPIKTRRHTREWGKNLERFEHELDEFSKMQHKKGKGVIVEGVQLLDDTMYPDKNYFKDKPVILLRTNPFLSNVRAAKRDGRKLLTDFKSLKGRFGCYRSYKKDIDRLSKIMRTR